MVVNAGEAFQVQVGGSAAMDPTEAPENAERREAADAQLTAARSFS